LKDAHVGIVDLDLLNSIMDESDDTDSDEVSVISSSNHSDNTKEVEVEQVEDI
jgi:hypothetical protein